VNYKHGKHDIELTNGGEFTTVLNGKVIRAPSLAAIKKKLDAAAKVAFKPFNALRDARYNDKEDTRIEGMVRVTVIGIEKSTGSNRYLRQKWQFLLDGQQPYGGQWTELTVDTPENIAAVQVARKYREETQRIKDERMEKQKELDDAIETVLADTFGNRSSD
jgi:hypothetical protein